MSHRVIYEAMISLFEQNDWIDLLTVVDALKKMNKLGEAGGPGYVSRLADDASSPLSAPRHAKMIIEAARRRELIRTGQSFIEAAHNEARPIEQTIEKGLNALSDSFPPPKGEIGKETNFDPKSAENLLSEKAESIHWVWERFIPEGGLVLLAAFMKVGKSTFAYPLAISIAQGRPFLGYQTRKGAVLILAVEEHERDVKLRLRRFGMRPDDPIYIHPGPLDNSFRVLAEIQKFIVEKGISAVFLDTLGRYWKIHDENNNAEVIRRVSPLLDLARKTNAAITLIHHERKSGGEDGKGIRGGSALFGIVDQALILTRREGGDQTQRVLSTHGRYDESPPKTIIALDENEWVAIGTPQEVGREEDKRKVVEALSDESQTVAELATEASISQKAVRKALKALEELVIKEGKGVKGASYTYRHRSSNSFLSRSHPKGEERNFSDEPLDVDESISLEEVKYWEER
jgi:RecA-family ATPase